MGSDPPDSKNQGNINYQEGLLKSHYNYFAEYAEIDDNGYYFSVKVNTSCINSPKKQIESIIKEVFSNSGIELDSATSNNTPIGEQK